MHDFKRVGMLGRHLQEPRLTRLTPECGLDELAPNIDIHYSTGWLWS
jgi:hypothetical protein